jgi:hypothetical protein
MPKSPVDVSCRFIAHIKYTYHVRNCSMMMKKKEEKAGNEAGIVSVREREREREKAWLRIKLKFKMHLHNIKNDVVII